MMAALTVNLDDLYNTAADLVTDPGDPRTDSDNPEYDRAIVEFITDLLGLADGESGHAAVRARIADAQAMKRWAKRHPRDRR